MPPKRTRNGIGRRRQKRFEHHIDGKSGFEKQSIEWDSDIMTVDEANDMFLKYNAEGNAKSDELTVLIAASKAKIRERFPD